MAMLNSVNLKLTVIQTMDEHMRRSAIAARVFRSHGIGSKLAPAPGHHGDMRQFGSVLLKITSTWLERETFHFWERCAELGKNSEWFCRFLRNFRWFAFVNRLVALCLRFSCAALWEFRKGWFKRAKCSGKFFTRLDEWRRPLITIHLPKSRRVYAALWASTFFTLFLNPF